MLQRCSLIREPRRVRTVLTYLLISLWAAIYGWRTVVGHWSFATNGYDLSVFDHAMWSVAHGGAGFVPFSVSRFFRIISCRFSGSWCRFMPWRPDR
jgi:uncharacterized membrane protein